MERPKQWGFLQLTGATEQIVRDAAAEFSAEDTAFIDDVLALACNVVFMCTHVGSYQEEYDNSTLQ